MTSEDGVDHDALAKVRDSMGDGYARLAGVFIDATRNGIDAIDEAWRAGDIDTVKRETHSLKSSSAMIGGKKLSQLAVELENTAKSGALPQDDTIIVEMRSAFTALESAMAASDA